MLIRIHDAGVNPVDWKIREGYFKASRARIRVIPILLKRNAAYLARLAVVVDKNVLRTRPLQTVSPDQAKKAQELMQSDKTHGKVILKLV